jgi:hypothetical protein
MAEATAARGKVCRVKDVEFKANPPQHEVTRGWPLVNPKSCPGAQLEFHITEIQPEGGALDDLHDMTIPLAQAAVSREYVAGSV